MEDVEAMIHGGKRIGEVERMADHALASFLCIMAGVKKSARLTEYQQNQALQARMPDFSVRGLN